MYTLLQAGDIAGKAESFLNKLKDIAILYVPKIAGAIIIYVVGAWIIRRIGAVLQRTMIKQHYDASLQSFLYSLVKISLTILLLVTIFGILGIDVTAFSALLVGVGLAVGTALNGSLGNFAGGVMLLIFKPFKVGDLIEGQGQTGTVIELGIFNTVILSPDHKTIVLANGPLSTGIIINYTAHGNLRVDIVLAVDAAEDINKARSVAINAMLALPAVLKTPAPEVHVLAVGDGTVKLAVRPYATEKNYWDVFFGAQEAVKKAWDAAGVLPALSTTAQVSITKEVLQ